MGDGRMTDKDRDEMRQAHITWFASQEQQVRAFVSAFHQAIQESSQVTRLNKAWLIRRLQHECSAWGIPYAHVDLSDDPTEDYLAIIRIIRDQIGAVHFNLLTRALNQIGTGVLPPLDEVSQLHRRDTLVALGRMAAERDNYVFVRAKKKEKQQTLEERVNLAFCTCLEALSERGPVVLIFDSYEKASQATDRWIHAQLLTWVYEGQLPRLIILTAKKGQLLSGSAWDSRLTPAATFAYDHAALTEYVYLFESRQPPPGPERSDG